MYKEEHPDWYEIIAVYERPQRITPTETVYYLPSTREIDKCIKWCTDVIGQPGVKWKYSYLNLSFSFKDKEDALAFSLKTGFTK